MISHGEIEIAEVEGMATCREYILDKRRVPVIHLTASSSFFYYY
jgi:hypothetical protein